MFTHPFSSGNSFLRKAGRNEGKTWWEQELFLWKNSEREVKSQPEKVTWKRFL